MADLNGFFSSIAGPIAGGSGIEAKANYLVYACQRGAYASASSTGTTITFDDATAAARFSINDYIQPSTLQGSIRRVTNVPGDGTIEVDSNVNVAVNTRIFNLGAVAPTIDGSGYATYHDTAFIYPRDTDSSTPITNNVVQTDSDGMFRFYGPDQHYDLLVQDADGAPVDEWHNVTLGNSRVAGHMVPLVHGIYDLGSASLHWRDLFNMGGFFSAAADGVGDYMFDFKADNPMTNSGILRFRSSTDQNMFSVDNEGNIETGGGMMRCVNVKDGAYGALGDNSTDDTSAISSALTAAAASVSGGIGSLVFVPKGGFRISSQLVVPDNVQMIGLGMGSVLRALGGFSGTSMLRMGAGTAEYDGIRIMHMHVDGNGAAAIGVYSSGTGYGSGIFYTRIDNVTNHAVDFTGGFCVNWRIESCYLKTDGGAGNDVVALAGGVGVRMIGVISNTTVISVGTTAYGVDVDVEAVTIESCFFGSLDRMVDISQSNVTVRACFGNASNVTTGVEIAASLECVRVENIDGCSGNLVDESGRGVSTQKPLGWWVIGDSSDGTFRSSDGGVDDQLDKPFKWGSEVDLHLEKNATVIDVDLTDPVLTLTVGPVIELYSLSAASVDITTITADADRMVTLKYKAGAAGQVNLKPGGNINASAGAGNVVQDSAKGNVTIWYDTANSAWEVFD